MRHTQKEDKALLELLRTEPEKGIYSLQKNYGGLIWHIVFRVLANWPEDAEEIASDVLLAVWQHQEELEKSGRPLGPWITVTARNRAIDRWRKLKRESTTELNEELGVPEDDPSDAEELISRLVKEMKEPDREIFLRRYYRMETAKEIGAALNMPPNTVNMRLARGRRKLKEHYETEMRKESACYAQ